MHVAIVGGGVVGTALAAALSDRAEVTLLERGTLGEGTTAASMAMIHRQQPAPREYDRRLRDLSWARYEPHLDDLTHTRIGSLYVAETEAAAERLPGAARTLTGFGIETEYVDPDELGEFGVEVGIGGLYTPEEGYFEPDELVERFSARAREGGARIETGVEVEGIDPGERVDVETTDGPVTADAVVNAAGPWAPEIDRLVGLEFPLRHTRGPILSVSSPNPPEPFTLFERGLYCRSHVEGAYVGRLVTDFAAGERLDPDEPRSVPESFREEAREFAGAIPALAKGEVIDEWVGLRTVTPDGRPLVGETAVEGYFIATGMSGTGVTLAPAVADLLADRLLGAERDLLEALSPALRVGFIRSEGGRGGHPWPAEPSSPNGRTTVPTRSPSVASRRDGSPRRWQPPSRGARSSSSSTSALTRRSSSARNRRRPTSSCPFRSRPPTPALPRAGPASRSGPRRA
ncbi:FAD-dependent oxidoreductase [Halalkalicoccus sp. NIPERK01]|nr:FAD-dependent oxidoreductase [Halalkalicoccus sp. NIPERK01]MDL5361689.1 FAD-dependent oxidoreductase [Halalkalicoccus sp. NIPERK01]